MLWPHAGPPQANRARAMAGKSLAERRALAGVGFSALKVEKALVFCAVAAVGQWVGRKGRKGGSEVV